MRRPETDTRTERSEPNAAAVFHTPAVRSAGERWLPVSGIVFVALFIWWLNLHGMLEPAGGQPRPSDGQIFSYITENQRRLHMSHFVLGLVAIAFLCFLAALRAALRRACTEMSSPPTVAFAGGLVAIILILLAGSILPGMADVLKRGAMLQPLVVVALFDLVGSIFSLVPFAVAALVGATSIAALRSKQLPSWIGWAGGVIVLFLLVGAASIDVTEEDPLWFVGILGMALWLVWVIAVSLALVLSRRVHYNEDQPVR